MNKKPKTIISCQNCSNDILISPSQKNRKYCSHSCRSSYERVDLTCNGCNKTFSVNRFASTKRTHCSKECAGLIKNWIGLKFGKLTILKYVKNELFKARRVLCLCDCGNEKEIPLCSFTKNIPTHHCGCSPRQRWKDLTGKKIGRLTVIKRLGTTGVGQNSFWLCKCDCGKLKETTSSVLRNGTKSSCGCWRREILSERRLDVAGQRFGSLIAVKITKKHPKYNKWMWEFLCDCGNKYETSVDRVSSGKTVSCGCRNKKLGKLNPRWKGGELIDSEGYVSIYYPEYPLKTTKYVREHRLVMEKHLGRYLNSVETVHHKNGIRHDNRLENLELWASSHPYGQRVEDLIEFSLRILSEYAPEKLKIR